MTDPERHKVAETDELPPGERRLVTVGGTSVGVFNVGGEYYALENECPHQHGPVCTGKIQQQLVADITEPGEFDDEHFVDRPTIACPWHGWEYDLETGVHLGDDAHGVQTFDVAVEDGAIYVLRE